MNEHRRVPATLDLVDRAVLGLNGLMGTLDPAVDYEPYFLNFVNVRPAYLVHWSSMVSGVLPKYLEAAALLRCMSGSTAHADLERGMTEAILANIADDGLIYDRVDPRRPWNVGAGYGRRSWNEDYANLAGNGRLACGMDWEHQLTGDDAWLARMQRTCERMLELAVVRGDEAYYPNVGCGNDFSWPRTSGWVHTDPPKGPQEGGEGATTFYLALPIRGLVRWYRKSGDERMLSLAAKLARFTMRPAFWGGTIELDPSYGPTRGHWWGHFHGNLAALRGLLEYAVTAGDGRAMEFVRGGYEWARHHIDPKLGLDSAFEGCCTGDLVALGIQLSDAGIADCWDDVDHVVRNALCAAQATDIDRLRRVSDAGPERPAYASWGAAGDWRYEHSITPKPLPGQETSERALERTIGCFAWQLRGGRWQSPVFMQCCTANGNQGFYFAWEAIVRGARGGATGGAAGDTATVNLFLNRFSPWVDVASWLPFAGRVELANRTCRRVSVRIPSWVRRSTLAVSLDGRRIEPSWTGAYVVVDGLRPGSLIRLDFPVATETATLAIPSINQRPFRGSPTVTARFRGSTCIGLEPAPESVNGADPVLYPLFDRPEFQAAEAPMRDVEVRVVEKPIAWW
jgi:hypothetical protein